MNSMKKTIKVALIAFINDDKKILLNRREDAKSEMWELIGGGIESGETALDAIKREMFEEIGYSLSEETDKLVFVNSFDYESKSILAKVYIFKAKYPGIENFSDSDETYVKDLKLFSVNDALNLTLLPMSHIILERKLLTI